MANMMPSWMRATTIVAGLISVVVGALIFLYPGLTVTILVYLLAFGMIIVGLERIVMGALG